VSIRISQPLRWFRGLISVRLDVNYGGSSGYGRKYIERLQGKWGVVDVDDCILAAKTLASEHKLIDPKRTVIRGGSAGGYTVLAALSIAPNNKVFAAATSSYGVSDLKKLSEFTHKFESRYLDHLVGGSVAETPEVYMERSPINHANRISTPLLVRCLPFGFDLHINFPIDTPRRD
jgi:dipeptidyl aminopeptidase/acylaminoacyl peptidase